MGSNNRRYRRVLCMILWFECVCYLDVSHHSSWLHSAGHIDCVAPDIIVRFTGSDHSSQNPSLVQTWRGHQGIKTYTLKTGHKPKYKHTHTHTLTDSKHEVVEGLFVKVVEGNFHSQGKVSQVSEVLPAFNQWLVLWLWNDSIFLSWWWSSAWTALVQQQADTLYHYICRIEAAVSDLAIVVSIIVALWCESWRSHVRASYRLDLSDAAKHISVK